MNNIFRYTLALYLSATLTISCGQKVLVTNQLSVDKTSITSDQEDLINNATKDFPVNTQLSVAIIDNGAVKYYGIKKSDRALKNIDNHDRVFEIGSISKVFTATLLAKFVVDGKVKLNDPINNYLDISLKGNPSITFQELANHTSGLPRLPMNLMLMMPDPNNPYAKYHVPQLEEYLTQQLNVSDTVDYQYAYSNLGAGFLGHTLTQIADSSYEELLKSYVFDRYGMTTATTDRSLIEHQLVGGLSSTGEPTPNWDLGVLEGAGAILSNVTDLAAFAQAQLDSNDEALALTRIKTTTVHQNMSVGLGWHLMSNESGRNWIWHNGGTGGYTSSMAIDLDHNSGIIILSNVSAFHPDMGKIDELCFALLKSLTTR